jgi:enoyl-[acyl-carrier-protein] reductase (NADH)
MPSARQETVASALLQDSARLLTRLPRRPGDEASAPIRTTAPTTPADLVGPAVWLASSASGFVNGEVAYVDVGITAER